MRSFRQKNRSLAGRISTADDNHLIPSADLRFHEGSCVINSIAFELFKVCDIRLVVLCPGGDDDAARLHDLSIFKREPIRPLIAVDLDHSLSNLHLSAEFLCLGNSAAREFHSGDARWKPNVVFYLRACAGLPSGKLRFNHQRVQALRSGVHRRSQSGRPCTDNGDIANV